MLAIDNTCACWLYLYNVGYTYIVLAIESNYMVLALLIFYYTIELAELARQDKWFT